MPPAAAISSSQYHAWTSIRHISKQCDRDKAKRAWTDKAFKAHLKPWLTFVLGTAFQNENRRAGNKKTATQSFQFDYFSPQIGRNSFQDEENFQYLRYLHANSDFLYLHYSSRDVRWCVHTKGRFGAYYDEYSYVKCNGERFMELCLRQVRQNICGNTSSITGICLINLSSGLEHFLQINTNIFQKKWY